MLGRACHEDSVVQPFARQALFQLRQLRHDREGWRLQVVHARIPHWHARAGKLKQWQMVRLLGGEAV